MSVFFVNQETESPDTQASNYDLFFTDREIYKKMGLLPSAFVKHGLIFNFTDSHSNKTPDPKSIKINS